MRPFINSEYSLLESLYKGSKDNIELLLLISSELKNREDIRSAHLLETIQSRLDKLVTKENTEVKESPVDPVPIASNKDEDFFTCTTCKKVLHIDWSAHKDLVCMCTNAECNRLFSLEYDQNDKKTFISFYEPEFIDGIICLDFGTSSIRAALSSPDGADTRVLKLGAVLGDRSDNFLDSNILVTQDHLVYFGYEAQKQLSVLSCAPLIYELSPKKWLTTDLYIEAENPIPSIDNVNYLQLLSGLLAYAISGLVLELGIGESQLKNYEIRISHPVWNKDEWAIKKNYLEFILRKSIFLYPYFAQGEHVSWLKKFDNESTSYIDMFSSVDIGEPIAAAIEVFHSDTNSRQICAVIDVGAGTTDFGLFSVITPEPNELNLELVPYRRKFKSISSPISINMAGDYIDEALLDIFKLKISNLKKFTDIEIERKTRIFKNEIRDSKPSFFEDGYLMYDEIELSYEELAKSKKIEAMVDAITRTFNNLIDIAKVEVLAQASLTIHSIKSIDLIIVGGGFQIGFIREAVPKTIKLTDKFTMKINSGSVQGSEIYTAIDEARLAVCRGGTTVADEWPNTNPDSILYGPLDYKYATKDQRLPD